MSRTEQFREQHRDLISLVRNINTQLNPEALRTHADEVRKTLSELAGKLSVHLAMEDKSLYSHMVASSHPDAKKTAENFMAEMGTLAGVFKDYVRRWPSADVIKANPSEFCAQTKIVFEALGERITREENTLYPMADAL